MNPSLRTVWNQAAQSFTAAGNLHARLSEQVRRNVARFPADFMLELNRGEYADLTSQIAASRLTNNRHRHPTEQPSA